MEFEQKDFLLIFGNVDCTLCGGNFGLYFGLHLFLGVILHEEAHESLDCLAFVVAVQGSEVDADFGVDLFVGGVVFAGLFDFDVDEVLVFGLFGSVEEVGELWVFIGLDGVFESERTNVQVDGRLAFVEVYLGADVVDV